MFLLISLGINASTLDFILFGSTPNVCNVSPPEKLNPGTKLLFVSFKFLNMQEPLLAIPLLIKAAQKNLISFEFTSTELKFLISSGNIMILDKNQIPHPSNNITMKISNKRQPQYSEETWDQLYDLSLETFVEESEEKKLSGAGAGLTDND